MASLTTQYTQHCPGQYTSVGTSIRVLSMYFGVQAKLSEAHRSHAAAVQQLEAAHAKAMRKAEASHAAAMNKVQTEAEAQLEGLTQQMEQLKRDVQAQLAERAEAESKRLKELEKR